MAPGLEPAEWRAFARRFVRPEGRVVDTGNGGISHSEGQGYALLCAERAGDRGGFDRILRWTLGALGRRGDALFAWRWRPDGAGGGRVEDPNNATDGDLMIAWALLRAGERWQAPDYAERGMAVARDVLRLLVRTQGGETVLLPGAAGFERRDHLVVNPSYYAFPALRALARAVPDPLWLQLAGDGIGLLRRARFGRWGLPPDWLALPRDGGPPVPAAGWPARFSYDALRVPLWLGWAGLGREPAAQAALRFWSDPRHARPPAWTDLHTDGVASDPAPAGVRAIGQMAVAGTTGPENLRLRQAAAVPTVEQARDYYEAILNCMIRLAWQDSPTGIV
jgi:endoglucanase